MLVTAFIAIFCIPRPESLPVVDITVEKARHPFSLDYKTRTQGKPPLRWYTFDCELENKTDKDRWYLMRYYGDDELPQDGVFLPKDRDSLPFSISKWGLSGFTEVKFYGAHHSKGFKAFRLPAQGTLSMLNLDISACSKIKTVEVWQLNDLLINDTTSLEQWLPFEVLCARDAVVDFSLYRSVSLNHDPVTQKVRNDFLDESIQSVKAIVHEKWSMTVEGE